MSTKRPIGTATAVGFTVSLIFWVVGAVLHAHVIGSEGQAPVLAPNIPGIDRPFPADKDKFTFAIIGDKTGGGEHNWPIFDRAMDEISRLRPDFAIMVGDLIQGYTTDKDVMAEEWEEFIQHARRIQVPFFFLPGNHDISNADMYDYWKTNVGRTYYSFNYLGVHFVALNTEEGWAAGEPAFGSKQLEWLREDLENSADAKHTFVFMHRPAWYGNDATTGQWQQVESWLGDRPYTVFAGHFHHLAYEKRLNRPYYVLSATGAGLTPREALEYGAFHHYTAVTVDGDDVHVAIIQPGNVHANDIARREFRETAARLVKRSVEFAIGPDRVNATIRFAARNPLPRPIRVDATFEAPGGSGWKIVPAEGTITVEPGEEGEIVVRASSDPAMLLPLPTYRMTVAYGDKNMLASSGTISPAMIPVREWLTVGTYDLGVQPDRQMNKARERQIPAFANALPPETNPDPDAEYPSDDGPMRWQKATATENGWLDLKALYTQDFVIAYGLTFVYSPDEQTVLASLRVDDLAKVRLNGEPVVPYVGYEREATVFLMKLRSGWNSILVKVANYAGAWGYAFSVADPTGDLRFSTNPER